MKVHKHVQPVFMIIVSLAAFVITMWSVAKADRAEFRARYWKVQYDLLSGSLLDPEFSPDMVPSIPADLWVREDIRGRAYLYLGRWAKDNPDAETQLNAYWQAEPKDGLRIVAEEWLRRAK